MLPFVVDHTLFIFSSVLWGPPTWHQLFFRWVGEGARSRVGSSLHQINFYRGLAPSCYYTKQNRNWCPLQSHPSKSCGPHSRWESTFTYSLLKWHLTEVRFDRSIYFERFRFKCFRTWNSLMLCSWTIARWGKNESHAVATPFYHPNPPMPWIKLTTIYGIWFTKFLCNH